MLAVCPCILGCVPVHFQANLGMHLLPLPDQEEQVRSDSMAFRRGRQAGS